MSDMVSWKMNKIDTVSPLRSRLVGGYSPRKKQLHSKPTASLGSLGNARDKVSACMVRVAWK